MALSEELYDILKLAKAKGIETEFISALEAQGIHLKRQNNSLENNDLDLAFQLSDPYDFMFEQYWEGIINK